VAPSGGISFRYNYRVGGRQETITLGRYGVGGTTLAEARGVRAVYNKAEYAQQRRGMLPEWADMIVGARLKRLSLRPNLVLAALRAHPIDTRY
jgi:hypothetical protein